MKKCNFLELVFIIIYLNNIMSIDASQISQ